MIDLILVRIRIRQNLDITMINALMRKPPNWQNANNTLSNVDNKYGLRIKLCATDHSSIVQKLVVLQLSDERSLMGLSLIARVSNRDPMPDK